MNVDLQVGDIRLFAEVQGNGPPLVCLHGGFGLDASYFLPALGDLARDHRLILSDLRGHGRSAPLPRESFRIEAVVEDLEALRTTLGHAQWAVLGHSGGGLIAASYAAAHPDRVSHLILCCSFPKFPFRAPRWLALAHELNDPRILEGLEMFIDGLTTDAEYREACLKIAPLFFADPRRADVRPFEKIIYRVGPYLEAMSHYAGLDVGPRIASYRQPVLVVHGAQDWRVPASEGKKWLHYLPHARWAIIPDAGHFPFIEQPVAFCDLTRPFLQTTSENQ